MNLKCNQSFNSCGDEQRNKSLPIITYRSIAIQTQSPSMVDKAVQVYVRRKVDHHHQQDYGNEESSANEIDIQDETKERKMKRKRRHFTSDLVNDRIKKQLLDELSNDDGNGDDHPLIGEHDDPMMKLVLREENQLDDIVGIGESQLDDQLDIDDLHIFTHQPTGLRYQIFNERRSINKEMMEQVFASVIGKEDKYYVCQFPAHQGLCHSQAGRSTKIRAVKNHLTSQLFLYRCRLCGRTYKYYNNLFNHFNRHP